MKKYIVAVLVLLLSAEAMGCAAVVTQVELKARNDALEIAKIDIYTVLNQAIVPKNVFGGACGLVLADSSGRSKETIRLIFYPDSGWNVCLTLSSQDRVKVNMRDEKELASGYCPNKEDWLTLEKLPPPPPSN